MAATPGINQHCFRLLIRNLTPLESIEGGIDSVASRSRPCGAASHALRCLSADCVGLGSNPRYGVTVHLLSKQAPSTARPPLRKLRTRNITRHLYRGNFAHHLACPCCQASNQHCFRLLIRNLTPLESDSEGGIDSVASRSRPCGAASHALRCLSADCVGLGSNPRYGVTVHLLSKQAPSTARPPLRKLRTRNITRHLYRGNFAHHVACPCCQASNQHCFRLLIRNLTPLESDSEGRLRKTASSLPLLPTAALRGLTARPGCARW